LEEDDEESGVNAQQHPKTKRNSIEPNNRNDFINVIMLAEI
jgi:hypothetical protein